METEDSIIPESLEPIVLITDHAYDRAKERLGWKHNVLNKMAEKALFEGIQHKDTKGTLSKYITKLWFEHKFCNNIRIYGEDIYFFKDNKLITLYRLEHKLIKHIKHFN